MLQQRVPCWLFVDIECKPNRSNFCGSPFRQHLLYSKAGVKQLTFCPISLDIFKTVAGPERQQNRATEAEKPSCWKQSSTVSGVLSATAVITLRVHGFIAAPTSRTLKRGHRPWASARREMMGSRAPSEICREWIDESATHSNLGNQGKMIITSQRWRKIPMSPQVYDTIIKKPSKIISSKTTNILQQNLYKATKLQCA